MKTLRHNSDTLALNKELIESAEIRSDRQIVDQRHGVRQVSGDIEVELAHTDFDDWLAAALLGSWASDVLKVGSTLQTFTVERRLTGLATPEFWPFVGVAPNSLRISIPAKGIVTAAFGCIGMNLGAIATTSLGSPTAASGKKPFDTLLAALTEGGASIATVTSMEITVENNLQLQHVVGSAIPKAPFFGRAKVSGQITALYDDKTLFEKFLNETSSSLVATLTDPDGNTLTITLPKVYYNAGDLPTNDEGPTPITLPFNALYDSAEATPIKFARSV
jgi:hypothetical protein